jgi:hypothetical protein
MISIFSPIATAATVNVDAILDIQNFLLRPSFTSIDANPTNVQAIMVHEDPCILVVVRKNYMLGWNVTLTFHFIFTIV